MGCLVLLSAQKYTETVLLPLPLQSLLFDSKFWTRNRPGDKMRDRYNLNLLPGMSEDGVEYGKIHIFFLL